MRDVTHLGLVFLVVLDDFLNDEVQEFLGKLRIEVRLGRQILEPRNLLLFARGVGWGKVVLRLEDANRLCVFEPLGQREHKDCVQPVNAITMASQNFGGAFYDIISQGRNLSV